MRGERQDLDSYQGQAAREEDVLMPEASDYASAARESHERADMPDGADSGEGWEREYRPVDRRGVIERVVRRRTRTSHDGAGGDGRIEGRTCVE